MVRGKKKHALKGTPQSSLPPPSSSPPSPPRETPIADLVSESRSTHLPFSLKDVKKHATECRQKVNGITWEELVEQPLMEEQYSKEAQPDYSDTTQFQLILDEACLAGLYHDGLVVARLHLNIAQKLVKDDGFGGTFENAWKMLPEDTRLGFVYCSFYKTSNSLGTVHSGLRRLCPDLSASTLCENGGRAMVELVRFIVQSGLEFAGTDYYPLPNEKFDRYFAIPKEDEESVPVDRTLRLWQLQHIHHRNRYLARFVFVILQEMGYFGTDEVEGRLLTKPCITPSSMPVGRALLRTGNMVTAAPSVRHALDPRRQPYKHEVFPNCRIATESEAGGVPFPLDVASCMSCRRMRDEVEELVKEKKQFSFCAKCLTLDPPHRVAYCSRDCQVQDWPTHKLICGKRFQDMPIPPFGLKTPPSLPPLTIDLQWKIHQEFKVIGEHQVTYLFRYKDRKLWEQTPQEKDWVPITTWGLRYAKTVTYTFLAPRSEISIMFARAIETRSEEDIEAFVIAVWPGTNVNLNIMDTAVTELANDWDVDEEKVKRWVTSEKAQRAISACWDLSPLFGRDEHGKRNGSTLMSEEELDAMERKYKAQIKKEVEEEDGVPPQSSAKSSRRRKKKNK